MVTRIRRYVETDTGHRALQSIASAAIYTDIDTGLRLKLKAM